MIDTNKLINEILIEIKQKLNNNIPSKVYHDEPIQRPNTVLHRVAAPVEEEIPEQIRNMKILANSSRTFSYSAEELFYQQGIMMADYEDDFEYYGEYVRYFPTYHQMNIQQLRGYFSWRTKIRNGEIIKTSTSFAYVYIYELLNQIGVKSPEDSFFKLKTFWEAYRELDPQINSNVKHWLWDYVIYYNLDRSLLDGLDDTSFDESLVVLLNYSSKNTDELFAAICALSSYRIENSKFYHDYAEDVKKVVCNVFVSLSEFYKKHRKTDLCGKLFGTKAHYSYEIFHSAVFFDRMKYSHYNYIVNDIHCYRCRNGKWSCEKYFGSRCKSKELGMILRTLDSRMREKYKYKSPLKPEPLAKQILSIIDKEIDCLLAEQKKNTVPSIELDLSKLAGIRKAADITRDKLIVEEELKEGTFGIIPEKKTISGLVWNEKTGQASFSLMENKKDELDSQKEAFSSLMENKENNFVLSKESNVDIPTPDKSQSDFTVQSKPAFPVLAWDKKTGQAVLNESIFTALAQNKENEQTRQENSVSNLLQEPHPNSCCETIRSTEESCHLKLTSSAGQDKLFSSDIQIKQKPQTILSKPQKESTNCPLNYIQLQFLRCLLQGEDYQKLLKEQHIMLSVLVDTINEALYEQLADTAIEFDGDMPKIIDDYIDDLKAMIS